MEDNGEQCMKEAVCCNCGGKHSAAYKGCPRYYYTEMQQTIQIKVDNKRLYAEGVKVHRAPVAKDRNVVEVSQDGGL